MAFPLRAIVDRPGFSEETLECGHRIRRPLGVGDPLPGQRRRCYKCGDLPPVQKQPAAKRGAPAQPRGYCPHCGKKGLGNTYQAFRDGRRAYRQCRYCDEITYLDA